MAQLPPIIDPSDGMDRLPQPYRMLDKFLAALVQSALQICDMRQQERDIAASMFVERELAPKTVLEHQAACHACTPAAYRAAGADTASSVVSVDAEGKVTSWTVAQNCLAEHHTWDDAPAATALSSMCCHLVDDRVLVAAAGPSTADAGGSVVSLYSLSNPTNTAVAGPTASTGDSSDGSSSATSNSTAAHHLIAQATVSNGAVHALCFSADGTSLAVSGRSGDLTVFQVPLACASQPSSASGSPAAVAVLQVTLQVVASTVAGHVGEASLLCSPHFNWQLSHAASGGSNQQATVKGMYVWWPGHSHLQLYKLPAVASAASMAASGSMPVGTWTLPHGILCAAATRAGRLMALGLANGSVVIWDDRLGGHRTVLPRLPSHPTCLAFVGGKGDQLLSATQAGKLYTSDLRSHCPSQTLWPLPQLLSVQEVLFPFETSLALLACSSAVPAAPAVALPDWARTGALPEDSVVGMGPPRLLWVDAEHKSMVAELQAPAGSCFCTAPAGGVDGSGPQERRLLLAQDGSMLVIGAYKLPPSPEGMPARPAYPTGPISWPSLHDRPSNAALRVPAAAAGRPTQMDPSTAGEPGDAPAADAEAAALVQQGNETPAECVSGPSQLLVFSFAQMRTDLGCALDTSICQQAASSNAQRPTVTPGPLQACVSDEVAAALARMTARLGPSERRQRERRIKAGLEQLLHQLAKDASSTNPPMLLAN